MMALLVNDDWPCLDNGWLHIFVMLNYVIHVFLLNCFIRYVYVICIMFYWPHREFGIDVLTALA